MSEQMMNLTEEERADILAKRKEAEIANGEYRQNVYNENVEEATKLAKERLANRIKSDEKLGEAYNDYLTKLNAIAPNHYKLEETPYEIKEEVSVQKLEYIDNEGRSIWRDEEGNYIYDTEEVVDTFTDTIMQRKIIYTGEVPEDAQYRLHVMEYTSGKYSWDRKKTFRVTYHGTGVGYRESNKKLANPKTIHDKIQSAIQWEIRKRENAIEQEKYQKRREALDVVAIGELSERFPNAEVEVKSNFSNGATVKFPNGTSMVVTYTQAEGEPIEYNLYTREVTIPNGADMDSLAEALASVTVTKEEE